MDKKEKYELYWVIFVIFLFVIVIGSTVPLVFTVGGNPTSVQPGSLIPIAAVDQNKVIQATLYAYQYYFAVSENGGGIKSNELGNSYYDNVMVAHPGEYINLTMYAGPHSATTNFYFPDYATHVDDVQIVPGLVQYAPVVVPNISGVFAFLNGEYNGPWFSNQVGLLLVLPQQGYISQSDINEYIQQTHSAQTSTLVGDPYNPPIVIYNSSTPTIYLVADKYAVFNNSVPGPTLVVPVNSTMTIKMYIPIPNNDDNFLYNYSASGQPYPVTNVDIGVYAVWWNGSITLVKQVPIQYNTTVTFTVKAEAPAYLYGLITPVFYNYNFMNMSNDLTGEQYGYVMGLWGAILVEG
ncbi:oxidase [Sulfolobus sp. A20]|uniref:oxidase n=1 Tax=Saccharolobus sp. A20 TaxID=1891280 RepID=UPI000845ED8F|nr:oxidase [Sulfolobus sp. A20]TRM77339.1 oxidase [Sulfolobus sp. A20-N-F8]TRM79200.1 oxidase [Sulfolobus sp. B5]TRM81035.1 oxidase [Sulfolobus sp. D5]TRM83451.1 oxidase [Sulfolobus sp. F3]TRM88598.1 oxidase [Sulfolobus sp. C3]TRM94604.1 oxidase [Sulfolobus sp. A20-N-G8]TRN02972.1 oxidase [Sulfolobus sp. F1]TRN04239.1 oxidase [Sulfolobus sp. E1]